MPQLVKGHLRFTDEDYAMQRFLERSHINYGSYSISNLTEFLQFEAVNIDNMKEAHITEHFDTSKNIKSSLTNTLLILTTIAKKEGLSLIDLMKND